MNQAFCSKNGMKTSNIIKVVASLCFILIAVALLVIRDSPASEYESSIYWSTPSLVWGCLIFSIICGIGIAVHQAYYKREDNLWVLGFILILLSNGVILSLHILRGYALWNAAGDSGSHLGIAQDIIASAHISKDNFYPVIHIYSVQFSQILSVNPIVPYKWMPVIFAELYMIFMYFVAKLVLSRKSQVILASVASTPLLYIGYYGWPLIFNPNHLAFLTSPLVLYLSLRNFVSGTFQWRVLFIIIGLLIVPFHPVIAFALFAILLTIWLPVFHPPAKEAADHSFQINIPVMVLLFVWGITWISSFWIWESTIRNIYTLVTEGGTFHAQQLVKEITMARIYGYSPLKQFFKLYTGIVLYIILALAAFPILRKEIAIKGEFTIIAGLYGPLGLIAIAIIVFYFLSLWFGPLRLLVYIPLICAIFVGFALHQFMNWATSYSSWWAKAVPILVTILLFSVSLNGITIVYPSPYLYEANLQNTETEIVGMTWFFCNKDAAVPISGWTVEPGRFAKFLLTSKERNQRNDIPPVGEMAKVPYHFGYDKQLSCLEFYDKSTYLVLIERDKRIYVDVFPEIAELRFLLSDFAKLENDTSVEKLYSNRGLDVYYVKALD